MYNQVINSWWLFTTFDGENGEQHHMAHSSLYIWVVLFLVMLALCLVFTCCWLCSSSLGRCCTWLLAGLMGTQA